MLTSNKLLVSFTLLYITHAFSITQVSVLDSTNTTVLSGSVMGGTKLNIIGSGFSTIVSENTVKVGPYPCMVQSPVTSNGLICTTTASSKYQDQTQLNISLQIIGRGTQTALQKFSYTLDQTPFFDFPFPSVSLADANPTVISLHGLHRISYLGNGIAQGYIYNITIGESVCSRTGIFQPAITCDDCQRAINCYQPPLQKAGKYNITLNYYPGKSYTNPVSYKSSQTNQLYTFVVLPSITQSNKSGLITGQMIDINGTGFSSDANQIDVKIDSVNCHVTESSLTNIKCKLDPKPFNVSSILQTNEPDLHNQFVTGSGFFYQRYKIPAIKQKVANFKQNIETGNLSSYILQAQSIVGQIFTPASYGPYYGQVWKGYFVPTVTGQHIFQGMVDDELAVYLRNDSYGSVRNYTSSDVPLIYTTTNYFSKSYPHFYTFEKPTAKSAPIYLVAGRHYYMEVYHLNLVAEGYIKISFQIPNNDISLKHWQVPEVQQLSSTMSIIFQVIQYSSMGVTSGSIDLLVYELVNSTMDQLIDQNITISWNASATQFCDGLKTFVWFSDYFIECNRTMKDLNGDFTTFNNQAVEFIWTVTIRNDRLAEDKEFYFDAIYSDGNGTFTQTNVQNYSGTLGGTFRLVHNNTPVAVNSSLDIPYNVNASDLAVALRKLPSMEKIQVDRMGTPEVGCRWIIYYFGYIGDVIPLTIDSSGMTGGVPGSSRITFEKKQNYSSNFFVDSLDYRWMRTYSNKPNILVTVNDIPAVCRNDCSYNFIGQLPSLISVQLSRKTIHTLMSDPLELNLSLSQLKVTIQDQECTQFTGNYLNFTCILPMNPNNTLAITPGIHFPVIQITPFGFIDVNGSFSVTVTNASIVDQDSNCNQINKQCPAKFLQTLSYVTIESRPIAIMNLIPNSRHILRPIFIFFSNFDDLQLYNYINVTFHPVLQKTFDAIEKLQEEKWQTISISSLWFNSTNQFIQRIHCFFNTRERIRRTSVKFFQIEENSNGYFLNTLKFFFSSFILLTFTFIVGKILYRILIHFNFKIVYLFNSFNFSLAFPLFCLDGNIQYMSYLLGFDIQNLWYQNFSQKSHSFFIIIWFFFFFLMIGTIYFGLKYFYRRKAKRFYDNCKSNFCGVLYSKLMIGMRNFLLGFSHFFIPEDPLAIYMKPALIITLECVFLVYMVRHLKRKNFFIKKFRQWIIISITLLRIILIYFLVVDLIIVQKQQLITAMFGDIYGTLLTLYIILWIISTTYELYQVSYEFLVTYNCQKILFLSEQTEIKEQELQTLRFENNIISRKLSFKVKLKPIQMKSQKRVKFVIAQEQSNQKLGFHEQKKKCKVKFRSRPIKKNQNLEIFTKPNQLDTINQEDPNEIQDVTPIDTEITMSKIDYSQKQKIDNCSSLRSQASQIVKHESNELKSFVDDIKQKKTNNLIEITETQLLKDDR